MWVYTYSWAYVATYEHGGSEGPKYVYGMCFTFTSRNGWSPKHITMEIHKDTETYRHRQSQVHDNEDLDKHAFPPQEGPPLTRRASHPLPAPGVGRARGRVGRRMLLLSLQLTAFVGAIGESREKALPRTLRSFSGAALPQILLPRVPSVVFNLPHNVCVSGVGAVPCHSSSSWVRISTRR